MFLLLSFRLGDEHFFAIILFLVNFFKKGEKREASWSRLLKNCACFCVAGENCWKPWYNWEHTSERGKKGSCSRISCSFIHQFTYHIPYLLSFLLRISLRNKLLHTKMSQWKAKSTFDYGKHCVAQSCKSTKKLDAGTSIFVYIRKKAGSLVLPPYFGISYFCSHFWNWRKSGVVGTVAGWNHPDRRASFVFSDLLTYLLFSSFFRLWSFFLQAMDSIMIQWSGCRLSRPNFGKWIEWNKKREGKGEEKKGKNQEWYATAY